MSNAPAVSDSPALPPAASVPAGTDTMPEAQAVTPANTPVDVVSGAAASRDAESHPAAPSEVKTEPVPAPVSNSDSTPMTSGTAAIEPEKPAQSVPQSLFDAPVEPFELRAPGNEGGRMSVASAVATALYARARQDLFTGIPGSEALEPGIEAPHEAEADAETEGRAVAEAERERANAKAPDTASNLAEARADDADPQTPPA